MNVVPEALPFYGYARQEIATDITVFSGDSECRTMQKFRIVGQENTKARPVLPTCIAPSPNRAAMLRNDSATHPEPYASAFLSFSSKKWLE